MKNVYLLLFSLLCLGATNATAQIVNLLDFNGANKPQGALPLGDLTLGGNVLYGMTQSGGAHDWGCIFSVRTDSTGYKDMYDFPGGAGGADPRGQLLLIGNKLYGSVYGGTNDSGFIFSIDTNGNTITNLFDFNGANGYDINGSFTLADGMLYGMSYYGGANNYGCVFKVDTNGTRYKDILDFDGANGKNATNGVTIVGNKVYGSATFGGANGDGCIFSLDTSGSSYQDLYDFINATGQNPAGSLTLFGTKFYSNAGGGGAHTYGCLFSYDTVSKVYKDIYDFTGGSGGYQPTGSLLLSGTTFYSFTEYGGVNNFGNVYSIDTGGTNYTDLFELDDTDGEYPDATGSLVLWGSALYGIAEQGGTHGNGALFSTDTIVAATSVNQLSVNNNQLTVYPNPSSSSIYVSLIQQQTQTVQLSLYNILGQEIWNTLTQPNTNSNPTATIPVTNLPDGVYILKANCGGVGQEKEVVVTR